MRKDNELLHYIKKQNQNLIKDKKKARKKIIKQTSAAWFAFTVCLLLVEEFLR